MCNKAVFFFNYFLATLMTYWANISPDLLFYALYRDTRSENIQDFDNYQTCLVPLKQKRQNIFVRVLRWSLCSRFPGCDLWLLSIMLHYAVWFLTGTTNKENDKIGRLPTNTFSINKVFKGIWFFSPLYSLCLSLFLLIFEICSFCNICIH